MRIGILTYHRAHNFGALMQTLATLRVFEKAGHEVYIIDYWPKYHKQMYSHFDWRGFWVKKSIRKKMQMIRNMLLYWKECSNRIHKMETFIHKYIAPFSKPYEGIDCLYTFDIVLYGSDQIWRKQPRMWNKFNPIYFGDNKIRGGMHIAWAASMGSMQLTNNDHIWLKEKLRAFDHIYVREKNLYELIRNYGMDCNIIPDPTLLLSSQDWDKMFPQSSKRLIKERYCLYYKIRNGINVENAKNIAKKKNLKFVHLNGDVSTKETCNTFIATDPIEMMSLIKNAEFVFTTSFHGIVFCIIYHINFYASFSENAERAETLLDTLGLRNRLLSPNSLISDLKSIDYAEVDKRLHEVRKNTINLVSNSFSSNYF